MILKPTRDLAKRLHLPPLLPATRKPSPRCEWYGRIIRIDRKPYILHVEGSTFFSVLVEAKGVTTPERYAAALMDALGEMALHEDFENANTVLASSIAEGFHFHKADSKRMIGIMNQKAFQADWDIGERRLSPLETARVLNHMITGPLQLEYPVEAFTGKKVGKKPRFW